MEQSDSVLAVRGLMRRFGRVEAVAGIDLDVARGEIVALPGPNGAGKTTTLTCVAGLLAPNSGTIHVAGEADRNARERRVAYVPEIPIVYDDLTPAEHLAFVVAGRRVADADAVVASVLERIGLTDARDRPAGTLSKGNRQRLCLGGALVARADVVLLDEPTTGLAPAAQHALVGLVRGLASGGAGVVISTHALATAFDAADRIVVIAAGRIVLNEPVTRFGDLDAPPYERRRMKVGVTELLRIEARIAFAALRRIVTHPSRRALWYVTGAFAAAAIAFDVVTSDVATRDLGTWTPSPLLVAAAAAGILAFAALVGARTPLTYGTRPADAIWWRYAGVETPGGQRATTTVLTVRATMYVAGGAVPVAALLALAAPQRAGTLIVLAVVTIALAAATVLISSACAPRTARAVPRNAPRTLASSVIEPARSSGSSSWAR